MMEIKGQFCALGGGNEIGASCYLVNIKGNNFMFDIGTRNIEKRRYPSLSIIGKNDNMDSLNDLDAIFLSHSHSDHNGAISNLAKNLTQQKEIICSEKTKNLTERQLEFTKKHENNSFSQQEEVYIDKGIGMLSQYSELKNIDKGDYNFTLFPAGHIPGAVMTLLECNGKKILYTGDFSNQNYPLTSKYKISKIKDLDLLIVNSTNLGKKSNGKNMEYLYKELNRIVFSTYLGKKNIINVNKLNHGMEIIAFLEEVLKKGDLRKKDITIYTDSEILELIKIIEDGDLNFKNVKNISELKNKKELHIVVSYKKGEFKGYEANEIRYSLHSDLDGIKELIQKLKPKKTFIVHYPKDEITKTIFQKEKKITEITFIENEKEYNF